jgi:Ca-activated chloride channel homolog
MRWLPVLLVLLAPAASAASGCAPLECVPLHPFGAVALVDGGLRLDRLAFDTDIVHDLATTRLALHVTNPGAEPVEAKLAFPLPRGATLLGFNLTVDGRVLEGEVRERVQARAQYQAAVEAGKDAVLLEALEDDAVRLSLHVPAGGARTLAAAYVEWVDSAGPTRIFRLPLHLAPADLGELEVRLAVHGPAEDPATRGPALQLAGSDPLVGSLRLHRPGPLQDLVVAWRGPETLRATLLAAAAEGVAPGVASICLSSGPPLARDVVFVVDRSGSMLGLKIESARDTLRTALASLAPGDRYEVVLFDSAAASVHGGLLPAQAAMREADDAALAQLEAGGSTNIGDALRQALDHLGSGGEALPVIVLLSDGLPTVGETDPARIVQAFVAANARRAHVHAVPVGLDADAAFLADLSRQSGGSFTSFDVDAQLATRLDRLYARIGQPLASDLQVTASNAEGGLLPTTLPVLHADGCVRIGYLGRWGEAPVTLRLSARTASGPIEREFTFAPAEVPVVASAAAVHGRMLVDELLVRERLGEPLRAAIVANATLHRQVTPYTSWVITDHQQAPPAPAAFEMAGTGAASSAPLARYHAGGVDADDRADKYGGRDAERVDSAQTPGLGLAAAALALAFAARRKR